MKRLMLLLLLLGAAVSACARPVPRPPLLQRLADGDDVIGIVHWGLNTYTDREWGLGDEDPALLNPAAFDADQIVGACKAGGQQGLIVVAKHHDGFCLWPTKTTGHNISKSPFRNGKGDYVKEMERACRKHGLKFGVYVSPWDRNNAFYGTEKYVTDIFQMQIRELLSGDYGEIFEMWFDGANGGDGYYGGAREKRKIPSGYYRYETETFAMVRKLQPNVCIFNESDQADFRFGGNERGIVDPDSRSTGGHYDGIWGNYKKWANTGLVDGSTFHPIEADFPLRPGWFYHTREKGKTKCAAYLMNRYLTAVGNAATMNLGISPNRDGRLDDEDVRALEGFGQLKKLFFSREIKSGEPFNVIVMKEDVSEGERIDGWQLVADGKVISSGTSVGIKRIRVLDDPVSASNVEVKVTSSCGLPRGVSVKRYFVDPQLLKEVLSATTESGETDTAKWMTAGFQAQNDRSDVESVRVDGKDPADVGTNVRVLEDGRVTVWATNDISTVALRWNVSFGSDAQVLGDAWERMYGDAGWRKIGETRDMPWYFLTKDGAHVEGWGVATQPGALASWRVSTNCVELVLDVRAGGRPVQLKGRTLEAVKIVREKGAVGESAWEFGHRFCKLMCPHPRLPKEAVYGYNDWYCAYGKNTATNFLSDAAEIVSLCEGLNVRPYVVMDDGWQKNSPPVVGESGHGPWTEASANFGMTMPDFAAKVVELGAKPGLWYRPLRAWDEAPASDRLLADDKYFDPTVPSVRKRIADDMRRFRAWGFKLVKVDFLTYDICQTWPCDLKGEDIRLIRDTRAWRDCSRTTAEVMRNIYEIMREAAGDDVVLIGCNALNHLGAGVFEIQRIGDDTSGLEWERTVKNGVNALAMRGIQDRAFFAIDADCVGLAKKGAVPWNCNRQWIELLSRSGTPFFVSWSRFMMDDDVRGALKAAFVAASQSAPTARSPDWMETPRPTQWSVGSYDWK